MPKIKYNGGPLDKNGQFKKSPYSVQKATKDSFEWFKKNIGTAFDKDVSSVLNKSWIRSRIDKHIPEDYDPGISITPKPKIGHLYFFVYDPKWKKELPYYDMFPLTMPIEAYDDGFLGMNFHYLPIMFRAKLLDGLLHIRGTKKGKEYLKVSYGVLQGLKNSPYKPTLKRCLWSHFRSPFAEVHFDVLDRIIFLPVEDFKKSSKNEVWKESKKLI